MQPLVFEYFSSNDHNRFLEDCGITLIDKTDRSDPTRRDILQITSWNTYFWHILHMCVCIYVYVYVYKMPRWNLKKAAIETLFQKWLVDDHKMNSSKIYMLLPYKLELVMCEWLD